ncbi:MAG: copper resistance protein CopC [Acidobacteria bacterium]|nr:copper resistance protein CopC [Acidobacteriota bacterium]
MKRLFTLALAVGLASTVVLAHLGVKKSLPAKDATVTQSPTAIEVWFTQEPEAEKSGLTLAGPSGPVTLGKLEITPEHSLRAALAAPLAAGAYTIEWKTAGDDGHVLTGKIGFKVADSR